MDRGESDSHGGEGSVPPSPARRYAAFISYAHADAAVAARLQRQIETYRLPKHTRYDDGSEGGGKRLGAVFRDREDLAAADDLSAAIREAIAQSRALIVVCSPAAAQSRWVNAEIRLFRELHPETPIFAAIASGDAASAFPPALTEGGREPLAADLTDAGDGRRLGTLKLIAALAGVPLDALIQRDAQRRMRRVMMVTVASGLAMIAMAVMTMVAINSRNEARQQRAEAEGLVEYMLTDLRQRLTGVGRLDIMSDVNERALQHYARQGDLDQLPPDSLARRARALHAMGEDDMVRGHRRAADAKFREAWRTTASLLATHPDDPEAIFMHAQSAFWRGELDMRFETQTTRHYFELYYRLARRLDAVDPDRVRARQELGYATGNLCALGNMERRPDVGICEIALTYAERSARDRNHDRGSMVDLGMRHAWLAAALERTGDLPGALRHFEQRLAIADQLAAADHRDMFIEEQKLSTLTSIVRIHFRLGDQAAARRRADEARAVAARLLAHDPENARWRRFAALINPSLEGRFATTEDLRAWKANR